MACALASTLPLGRHAAQRVAAAPAFGAAAAFAAVYEPGVHLLPAVVAVSAVSAGVVAAVARALGPDHDEALVVWIVSALVVFAVCGAVPLMEWDARVAWALLVLLAMLAARFVPSLAIDVPDETLIDLDRLAVTAWSARDGGRAGRGRIVVSAAAMRQLVAGATRTVTAACAAIMVTAVVATPLLLATATIDLDRIGARCLAFFAGASILLAARSYRHTVARRLLRVGGLACWLWLVGFVLGRRLRDRGDGRPRRGAAARRGEPRGRGRDRTRLALGVVVAPRRAGRGPVRLLRARRDGRRVGLLPQPVGNHVLRFRPLTPGYIDLGTGGRDVSPNLPGLHGPAAHTTDTSTTNQ